MENSDIGNQKEVKNSTIVGKSDVDAFLRSKRVNFGTVPIEGHNTKQCPFAAKCFRTN
jgi:hypothetical protein